MPKLVSGGRAPIAAISSLRTLVSAALSPPPPYSLGQSGTVQPRAAIDVEPLLLRRRLEFEVAPAPAGVLFRPHRLAHFGRAIGLEPGARFGAECVEISHRSCPSRWSVLARIGTSAGRLASGSGDVDFDLTERQTFFRDRVRAFIESHVRPRVADYHREIQSGDRWQPLAADRGAEAQGARGRPVEPVHAARRRAPACRRELRVRRRAAHQPRICAVRRGNGPHPVVGRSVQLLGPRHRQYGSASTATARASRRSNGSAR